ncbi:sugar kinase [Sulfitobacter sp.]|uniref:sugar kinase n=1 Tax=Sulfitobacter sp. TaxID=1903071 RepID=UPI003002186E
MHGRDVTGRGLRRLLPAHFDIDYLTAVGRDSTSDQMIEFMRVSGLGTDHIQRRADLAVGLYVIQLDQGERSFAYWREQSAARTLARDIGVLERALKDADVVYFSGITIAILSQEDRRNLLQTLGAFRTQGGMVVFDPNLRPQLWTCAQEMTDIITQAAAVSTTVLPSHADEAEWFGDRDSEATAARYVSHGVLNVIVKDGAKPILGGVGAETSWHKPEIVEHPHDTTAAGDSFNAGYLAATLEGKSVAQAIRAGASLAAHVIRSPGALVEVLKA